MAFVYLLRCADGSLYCGWTVDVPKRVRGHARGTASRYTAARPHTLAAAWEVPTRTDARRLEARSSVSRAGEAGACRRHAARRCNTGAVCFTRAVGQVPPATGMAPAFLEPEKAMLDGVREHATTIREHMNTTTDPDGADERARSARRPPAHDHRSARHGRPARRVGHRRRATSGRSGRCSACRSRSSSRSGARSGRYLRRPPGARAAVGRTADVALPDLGRRPSTASASTGWNAASHGASSRRLRQIVWIVVTTNSATPRTMSRPVRGPGSRARAPRSSACGCPSRARGAPRSSRRRRCRARRGRTAGRRGDDQPAQAGVGGAQSLAHGAAP